MAKTQNKSVDKEILFKRVFSDLRYFIAFGFGAGLLPKMPGTWGTLVAIPIVILFSNLSLWLYGIICFVFFILGVYVSQVVTDFLNIEDFSGVVWDEVVGYLITMMLFPKTWFYLGLGFIIFRIFDILKPWPINYIDSKIKGGLGIMLDDALAACYSVISLFIIMRWL